MVSNAKFIIMQVSRPGRPLAPYTSAAWCRKAADNSSRKPAALTRMAQMHEEGIGVAQSHVVGLYTLNPVYT
jgi:TPR repeat protein